MGRACERKALMPVVFMSMALMLLFSSSVFTQPFDPQLVGTITYSKTNLPDLQIRNDFLYASVFGNGLATYSISDPEKPVFKQKMSPGGVFPNLLLSGDFLYASANLPGSGSGWLVTASVSDPSAPAIVSKVATLAVNATPHQLVVNKNRLYLLVAPGQNQHRMQVYDISSPGQPAYKGELFLGTDLGGIALVNDNTVIIIVPAQGIKIVNVADPANCQVVATAQTTDRAGIVEVRNNLAYVGTSTGLDIFDLSNLTLPNRIGTLYNGTGSLGILDIQFFGDYLLCASGNKGFQIVDVKNPASPQSIFANFSQCPFAQSIAVTANHAFVGDFYYGVRIFKLRSNWKSNSTPIADAGEDVTVEAASPGGAEVPLDGSGSTDPDGNLLTYAWYENANPIAGPTTDAKSSVTLPLGDHSIKLIVNDGQGATSSDEVVIHVVDTTQPQISLVLSKNELWPANHKMVTIQATVVVSDACDPNPLFSLSSIINSERANGSGDGNTDVDIQGAEIGTADVEFSLRAERSGKGTGRYYFINYRAVDASGNIGTVKDSVWVGHDASKLKKSGFQPIAGAVPETFVLFQNYPNPFNPTTTIEYGIPEDAHVLVEIYNVHGDRIAVLQNAPENAGYHSITWDGRNSLNQVVSGGTYLCRIQAGRSIQTLRMSMLK